MTEQAGEMFRILSKSTTAGIEVYDAWLEGLHDLSKESFLLCRKMTEGEKADIECILNITSEMCENVTNRMMNAAKDTPIELSLQNIQKSMDFKKNGDMMKAILQPGIDMSISMMAMFKSYKSASEKILKPVSAAA